MTRLAVEKTYKLYIDGKFSRSESGRSIAVENNDGNIAAHICHCSSKDVKNAIDSAAKSYASWSSISGYLRGQILYRMAEMLEGRREEFVAAIRVTQQMTTTRAKKEVDASVDRLVRFAGWADKFQQVLGCSNPVAGQYYNFTVPQAQGVVVVFAPPTPSLLGLVTLLSTPLSAGNTVVVIGSSEHPISTAIFGEVCQTSDVPAGAVNVLTGLQPQLYSSVATHRQVSGIYASGACKEDRITIQEGAADNLKRILLCDFEEKEWYDNDATASPWNIEPFIEMKTIWHPSSC